MYDKRSVNIQNVICSEHTVKGNTCLTLSNGYNEVFLTKRYRHSTKRLYSQHVTNVLYIFPIDRGLSFYIDLCFGEAYLRKTFGQLDNSKYNIQLEYVTSDTPLCTSLCVRYTSMYEPLCTIHFYV